MVTVELIVLLLYVKMMNLVGEQYCGRCACAEIVISDKCAAAVAASAACRMKSL